MNSEYGQDKARKPGSRKGWSLWMIWHDGKPPRLEVGMRSKTTREIAVELNRILGQMAGVGERFQRESEIMKSQHGQNGFGY